MSILVGCDDCGRTTAIGEAWTDQVSIHVRLPEGWTPPPGSHRVGAAICPKCQREREATENARQVAIGHHD